MRKLTSVVVGILVLIVAFSQLILPALVGGNAAAAIKDAAKAENVTVNISSVPGFLLLAGKIDTLDIVVDKAKLHAIEVEKMTLHGEKVEADFSAIHSHDGSAIRSAETLELTGVVTQEALQEMLVKKLSKVENLQVYMNKDNISATGQIKLMGRVADVILEGNVAPENGALYFHMTRLDIRNMRLGQSILGDFFGDVLVFDLYDSPVRAEIDEVEQLEGQVIIKAHGIGSQSL